MTSLADSAWIPWIALLAGAIHVLAPDHWLPASVLFWQRGYGPGRAVVTGVVLLSMHIAAGLLLSLGMAAVGADLSVRALSIISLALAFLILTVRMVRFTRTGQIFTAPTHRLWGLLTVASFLGPAESLIPILIRSRAEGMGYLVPLAAYALGTFVGGIGCILAGRYLWNRPLMLPRGLSWIRSRRALIPLLTGIGIAWITALKG